MTEEDIIKKAEKRVKAKKGFYAHLSSYVISIGFFFFVNLLSSPGDWWFFWPALGWGIGLASHYIAVFGFFGSKDDDWEERELEKEIERLKRKRNYLPEPEKDLLESERGLELKELKKERSEWDDQDFV
jgi:hypothetical protein